jgi:hypothetical protein
MPYNYNIPQATDQLNVSQPQILANFSALGVIGGNTSANSSALNGTAGLNYLFLASGGANPPVGTTFGASNAIFSSVFVVGAGPNQNEIFINKQNQATPNVTIPMTASILSQNSAPGANSTGWTYLPSGILMKWTQSVGAHGINFNAGGAFGPNFTQVIMAWVTGNTVTAGVASTFAVTSIGGAATVNVGGAAPGNYYVLAIGY